MENDHTESIKNIGLDHYQYFTSTGFLRKRVLGATHSEGFQKCRRQTGRFVEGEFGLRAGAAWAAAHA